MADPVHNDAPTIVAPPIVIAADDARGALASDKIAWGATLFPMLVGGLILIVVGMIVAVVLS